MKIYIVSGYSYWGSLRPEDLFEHTTNDIQIGGGETAMLNIARELAKKHDVTLFYNMHPDCYGQHYGINFMPVELFVHMSFYTDFDALIVWDNTHVLRYTTRAKVVWAAFQLNDPFVGVYDWCIDRYLHPSQWHADRTREQCPEVRKEKQLVGLTNGIDYTRYVDHPTTKYANRVVYSSSPDRGLHHLLRIWPQVTASIPDAELHVYYDMQKWLDADEEAAKNGMITITHERAVLLKEFVRRRDPTIFFHGGIGQHRLAEEQLLCAVMCYPCDPVRPTEGFSMSILEGISAGCHVITSDADALKELWEKAPNVTVLPLPFDDKVWVSTLVETMRKPLAQPQYNPKYAWATLAQQWEMELLLCLREKSPSLKYSEPLPT